MLEENFRRAMVLSHGDLMIYLQRPIGLGFIIACVVLILLQLYSYLRVPASARPADAPH
ncbi:TctA family transporter [Bradyrhizobium sp. USDA 4486]